MEPVGKVFAAETMHLHFGSTSSSLEQGRVNAVLPQAVSSASNRPDGRRFSAYWNHPRANPLPTIANTPITQPSSDMIRCNRWRDARHLSHEVMPTLNPPTLPMTKPT